MEWSTVDIIDFHIQVWKKEHVSKGFKEFLKNFAYMANIEEFPNKDYTPELYLEHIEQEKEKDVEKYKIDKAIIFPIDYTFTKIKFTISYEKYLDYIVEKCDEYKGIFYSLVGPDPRHGNKALEMMDRMINDCDFKGLVISPSSGYSLDNPILDEMIAKAGEYKVPVVFHDIGLIPRPLKLVTNFMQIDEILIKFDKQLFIFCPFTQMDMDLVRVGIRHRDHLMTDISAFNASDQVIGNSMPGMFKSQTIIMIKEAFGSDKLLFGSDWPWYQLKAPVAAWAKEVKKMKTSIILKPFGLPNVDEEEKALILRGNALRVLNL